MGLDAKKVLLSPQWLRLGAKKMLHKLPLGLRLGLGLGLEG